MTKENTFAILTIPFTKRRHKMAVKSTINLQKDFDLRVREFVGKEMHAKFLALGIGISHIKKICIKIGKKDANSFKEKFLSFCGKLIQNLEKLVVTKQAYSKNKIKQIISILFLEKSA